MLLNLWNVQSAISTHQRKHSDLFPIGAPICCQENHNATLSRDFCRRLVVFPRLGYNFRFNAHLRDSAKSGRTNQKLLPKTARKNRMHRFHDQAFNHQSTLYFSFKLIASLSLCSLTHHSVHFPRNHCLRC